jgi:hypothetical protein
VSPLYETSRIRAPAAAFKLAGSCTLVNVKLPEEDSVPGYPIWLDPTVSVNVPVGTAPPLTAGTDIALVVSVPP